MMLVETRGFVSIDIQLGIQREVYIGGRIVLVTLNVLQGRFDLHGLDLLHYFVCDVPIGYESKVGEGLLVWKTLFDPSKA
jgi:hypothetical protein